MKLLMKVLVLMIILIGHEKSFAWGTTGHRVVAEIAERHLTKAAKRGISELFGREPLAFWANWPDFIKSDTTHEWDHTSKWHYVDVAGNVDKEEFLKELKAIKGENLYTQIPALMAEVKDKNVSLEKRKYALAFLIHLIGDLHQPLHVGRDEDQGGNKIQLTWFDKPTNLHSLWDSGLIDFQQYTYTEYATVLDVVDKNQQKALQQSTLDDWFYESHVLSDKVYAQSPAGAKLGYKYNYIFQGDLNNQLLKGGLRLAEVLNEVFK